MVSGGRFWPEKSGDQGIMVPFRLLTVENGGGRREMGGGNGNGTPGK